MDTRKLRARAIDRLSELYEAYRGQEDEMGRIKQAHALIVGLPVYVKVDK